MSSLRISASITPTLTGVMIATALGGASINAYPTPNMGIPPHHEAFYKTSQFDISSTSETFSPLALSNSSEINEIDNLMLQVFEKISKDSKPLDEKFAKILSDNILDLF
ncbi:hypothetical protein ACT4ZY_13970 [Acinetobacter baumannii]|nr:hypothetical protein [Acinetobacter baumannii]ELA7823205.1 hypothetical protein [Acinetobacter baumannii]MDC4629469.1 hypothetical protein [Acinetobacter baumannii]MDC4715258.1 hypothetical protein [Acinetobacter baumannii]